MRVAEILPLEICCWGVGSGCKGSYNSHPAYIQFEICEDNLTNRVYYTQAFQVAAQYRAHLCQAYEFGPESIVSHKEAHAQGYGSNHSDPEHWMKKFGQTVNDFRGQVGEWLKQEESVQNEIRSNRRSHASPVSQRRSGLYCRRCNLLSWPVHPLLGPNLKTGILKRSRLEIAW